MTGRFRRWAGHTALATGLVTMAGLSLVATAPAQASTAGYASGSALQVTTSRPASSSADDSAAAAAKAAAEHYTDAPCNTTGLPTSEASCFAVVYTAVKNDIAASPDDPPSTALGPAQIQSAYNLPSATAGNGETVAIVDAYGDSDAESDLATFRSYYDLPPCTTANGCFTKVAQDGSTNYPPDSASWGVETSLDLDAVSSACPNCHILLVEADDNTFANLGIAEDEAVSLGAKFVSNSYGADGDETAYDSYYEHPGVAVDAATGDTGDVDSWPADNPDVTAVGGTTLTADSSVPRGWEETAWDSGGSGCSPDEPQPSYQADITSISTACPNHKATADVSADADPNSGLATYDTLGESGWMQVGGTSLATPLITAVYALAGTPAPGTYPVSYPYTDPTQSADLNDVTTGSNGGCGNVLCTAGPGWDGPTGLGTPNGVAAFTTGPEGTISGQVTDSSTGDPVAGATVTAGSGLVTTTDSSGDYSLPVRTGSYTLTVTDFGYKTATVSGVTVGASQTTTENVRLSSVPDQTLSGAITDGSGHKWPLYAKITVAGYPGGAIYTSPYTGHYSVRLPQSATYSLTITPLYPGYETKTVSVHLGTAAKVANEKAIVDPSTCSAPGYAIKYTAADTEDFTGWSGTTPEDGWTDVDNEGNGEVWSFSNPGNRPPPPGGDSDFAIVDSDHYGYGQSQDTSLVSPVIDLSGVTSPEIGFDTEYLSYGDQTADVDLSLDGGQTWTTVWSKGDTLDTSGLQAIPIPQAAGQSDVQVRFHFAGGSGEWWSIDNVFIGSQTCSPTKAGLVAGVVTDGNTGAALDGATVASVSDPGNSVVTAPTADPDVPDGFYWMLSPTVGDTQFTATDGRYVPSTVTTDVAQNGVTEQNFALAAGHITLSASSVQVSEELGAAKTKKVKFTNDGTQPVTVQIGEQEGGYTPAGAASSDTKGAPLKMIKGRYSTAAAGKATAARRTTAAAPSDSPWATVANYPTTIMDNAAAYDPSTGDVYSIGGYNGSTDVATSYVYSPSAEAWTQIASAPQTLQGAAAAFLNGEVYVVGGWSSAHLSLSTLYTYNPSANSWTQLASMPAVVSYAAVAVLGGDLYVVGGCTGDCAPTSDAVFQYAPSTNTWTQLANYPVPVAYGACAGVDGEVVCAGGVDANDNAAYTSTYIYDPASNTWSQGANMPYNDWGMAYAGSDNELQIADGITDNGEAVTNKAAQYDPSSNSWSSLPNADDAEYRGGSACGVYTVGGSAGGFSPTKAVQNLPGYDDCGTQDVPWLSESQTQFTVAPGSSVTVAVTADSSSLTQPGTYTARLAIVTDSPYQIAPIPVTMTVTAPPAWGKIDGTVTDASTGDPVAGAIVQICTMYVSSTNTCGAVSYTLKTDSSGYYQLWLNKGYSPLQVIVAANGYLPVMKVVKIVKGGTVTTNFALAEYPS